MLSYSFHIWPNMKTTTIENYLKTILYVILITGCIERQLCVKQKCSTKTGLPDINCMALAIDPFLAWIAAAFWKVMPPPLLVVGKMTKKCCAAWHDWLVTLPRRCNINADGSEGRAARWGLRKTCPLGLGLGNGEGYVYIYRKDTAGVSIYIHICIYTDNAN